MNVFEDLIEELRDENLLEETVIGPSVDPNGAAVAPAGAAARTTADAERVVEDHTAEAFGEEENSGDFYHKRAMDEISSLQMVEHVISGIEREYLRVIPKSYDDLEAKKALHRFLQVQDDSTKSEYAEAEFQLMHQTEAWNTALSARDEKISVANLRRFCENSRPVLSSQALMALGRFYRNASFSEPTRAKFDYVMTRLFSREVEDEHRRLLFGRDEMVGHLRTLYASWASVALYSTDENSLKTRAVVAGFEDRVQGVEKAESFDELIRRHFFDKIHEFKEATGEMFFTPEIVAAAIDCNVRMGNRFVELIQRERERASVETVERKYGYEYDQIISDAAGKTLHLVDLLKSLPEPERVSTATASPDAAPEERKSRERFSLIGADMFQVNKWLLLVTVLVLAASAGLYVWSNQASNESSSAVSAKDVNIQIGILGEFLRTGRASSETLYAITLPSWDQQTDEKKNEILQQALIHANNNGLQAVQLLNVRGRTVGVANASKSEILNPTP